jgi:hypothetical protein
MLFLRMKSVGGRGHASEASSARGMLFLRLRAFEIEHVVFESSCMLQKLCADSDRRSQPRPTLTACVLSRIRLPNRSCAGSHAHRLEHSRQTFNVDTVTQTQPVAVKISLRRSAGMRPCQALTIASPPTFTATPCATMRNHVRLISTTHVVPTYGHWRTDTLAHTPAQGRQWGSCSTPRPPRGQHTRTTVRPKRKPGHLLVNSARRVEMEMV